MQHIVYYTMVLVGFLSHGLAESSIQQWLNYEYGQHHMCLVEYGPGIIDECDVIVQNGGVPSGSQCRLIKTNDGITYQAVCMQGQWFIQKRTNSRLLRHRKKRGFFCSLLGWFCKTERITVIVVNKRPQFTDCPTVSGSIKAEKGSTSATVTWNDPTATDPENDKVTVSQSGGGSSGSKFEKGQHSIMYDAIDSKGNKEYCQMKFNVTVLMCSPLEWPRNGIKNCDGSDHWGTICRFTCDEGYEIHGADSATCEEDGSYSDSSPTCSRVKCPKPDDPEHGKAVCSRPEEYSFSSQCLSHCEYGYTATEFIYSECKENKKWSNALSTCDDVQPPKITCPSIKKAYIDQMSSTANVTWKEPIASDNSDGDVIVELIDPTLPSGSLFQVGYTPVTYQAIDEAGNISPTCTVMVIVETLSCSPPILTDNFIVIECPSDSLYQWGSSCNLSCLANLPLIGSDTITCERVNHTAGVMWTWNSQEEPYCKKIECPKLDPPLNGALSCDTGLQLKMCNLMCNEEYDISPRVISSTLFVCASKEIWTPAVVPDCSVKRNPERINLPSELYYFSGTCGDESANKEIRDNFMARIDELQQTEKWASICTEISCDITNIEIICGETESNKKRKKKAVEASHKFTFMISADAGGKAITRDFINNTETALHVLAEVMDEAVQSGTFDISGLELRQYAFASAEFTEWECPYGQYSDMQKFYKAICVGCPVGTSYDGQDGCPSCPTGTYRETEDEITCTDCPEGKWTPHKGAVKASSCKDICQAGSYSLTGLSPCSPCPVGEYQNATMATNCDICPPGTLTETESTKTDSKCLDFDMLMYANGTIYVDTLLEVEIDSWTMATWLYWTASTGYIRMAFGDQVIMNFSADLLAITIQDTTVKATIVAATGQWLHIAVRTSMTSRDMDVFVNGALVELSDTIPSKSSNVLVSHLELSYNGREKTGMKISGFIFVTSSLTDDNIQKLSSSCNVIDQQTYVAMDDLARGTNNNVDLIIPTQCDEYDDCQDQPCGNNVCENEQTGYICSCSGGFTGDRCEIPPDYCAGNACQNGATCRSGNDNYTCDCLPGYSGEMCQDAPINGQWSVWSDWSVCDVTCGGGTKTRQRFCDSPPPDGYGLHCQGNDQDHVDCKTHDCPSCTELGRPYASLLKCDKMDDMTHCNLTCRIGYAFPPGHEPNQLYNCGIQTNYEWQHTTNDNPLGDLPSCSKIGLSNRLSVKTEATYSDFPCVKEEGARNKLIENQRNLPCVMNDTCIMEVAVNGCEQAKRRRRATKSITVTETFTIPIESGELDLASFFESGTVTRTLDQIIQAANELELIVQALENNVQLFLDIDLDGTTYHVNVDTVTTTLDVGCPEGSVSIEVFCVECTPGTFYSDGLCVLCEKGTYQDNFGQSSCIQCPAEKTTLGKGSTASTYCGVTVLQTTKSTPSQTTYGQQHEMDKEKDVLIIALLCGFGFLAVVILVFAIYVFRYQKRKNSRRGDKGSFVCLGMVRPQLAYQLTQDINLMREHPPTYDKTTSEFAVVKTRLC